jgi:ABC-2 type transport system permease protein
MAASSVWMVRNSGLYEVWFYITQFARYPADIYRGNMLGLVISFVLMFVMPVLLAISVQARVGAKLTTDGWLIAYLVASAVVSLTASRWFFRFALRAYRSASS